MYCIYILLACLLALWSSVLLLFHLYLIFRKMVVLINLNTICWDTFECNAHPLRNGSKLPFNSFSLFILLFPPMEIKLSLQWFNKCTQNENKTKKKTNDLNICSVFINNFDEIVYNNIKFHVELMYLFSYSTCSHCFSLLCHSYFYFKHLCTLESCPFSFFRSVCQWFSVVYLAQNFKISWSGKNLTRKKCFNLHF